MHCPPTLALSPPALHNRVPADTATCCPPLPPQGRFRGVPAPGRGGSLVATLLGPRRPPPRLPRGPWGQWPGPPCPGAVPPPRRVSAGWAAAACTPRYGAEFGGGHRLLCHLLPHRVPLNPSLCPPLALSPPAPHPRLCQPGRSPLSLGQKLHVPPCAPAPLWLPGRSGCAHGGALPVSPSPSPAASPEIRRGHAGTGCAGAGGHISG